MTDRDQARMPYTVQVEFRTPSSFLVAYSVNLSRGGLFIETDADIPTGGRGSASSSSTSRRSSAR